MLHLRVILLPQKIVLPAAEGEGAAKSSSAAAAAAQKAHADAASLVANGGVPVAAANGAAGVKAERGGFSSAQLDPLRAGGSAIKYGIIANGIAPNGVKTEPGVTANGVKAEAATAAGASSSAPEGGLVRRTSRAIKPRLMMVRGCSALAGPSEGVPLALGSGQLPVLPDVSNGLLSDGSCGQAS